MTDDRAPAAAHSPSSTADDQHRSVKAQEKLAQSAGALKQSAAEQIDSADRRTTLAADRTVLAAERTYAAWVRTGLAALASGVGARALLERMVPEFLTILTGSLLILFSAFCFLAAVWRQMFPGAPPPRPDTKRIPPAILALINGFLVLVSLAALVGLWIGRHSGLT
jgi:putative membrane protein